MAIDYSSMEARRYRYPRRRRFGTARRERRSNRSEDGKRIATVAGHLIASVPDVDVKLWDAATGRELLNLKADMNGISGVQLSFSLDGHRLFVRKESASAGTMHEKVLDATPRRE